jgi:hypothetical protein
VRGYLNGMAGGVIILSLTRDTRILVSAIQCPVYLDRTARVAPVRMTIRLRDCPNQRHAWVHPGDGRAARTVALQSAQVRLDRGRFSCKA